MESNSPGQEGDDESSETISSLRSLVAVMANPVVGGQLAPFLESSPADHPMHARVPPLDAVLDVLRWAKGASGPGVKFNSRG